MGRTVKQVKFSKPPTAKLMRVAAYARVSSGKDAMLHSLSAQVSHYNYEKYEKYTRRFDALKEEYDTLEKECRERREKFDVIGAFIDALETVADIPIEFDEDTFTAVVEKLTVYADERVEFTFKGGVAVTRQL